jgi:hypothetical protein
LGFSFLLSPLPQQEAAEVDLRRGVTGMEGQGPVAGFLGLLGSVENQKFPPIVSPDIGVSRFPIQERSVGDRGFQGFSGTVEGLGLEKQFMIVQIHERLSFRVPKFLFLTE